MGLSYVNDANPRLQSEHWEDDNGLPLGGTTSGPGLCIGWQYGPRGQGALRRAQNGAQVEDVIAAAIDRVHFLQAAFPCAENELTMQHLDAAYRSEQTRTARRQAQHVEGLHTPHVSPAGETDD